MRALPLFTLVSTIFVAACGGGSSSSSPDAAPPVEIGVGSPICQGHATGTPADIAPNLPTEIGDPALARITPPSYPFTVTSVSYKLTGMEATCGTNIAHAVSVWADSSGATPASSPASVQKIPVAASATDQRSLIVTESLPTPITLTTGQDLFVAVEMDANTAQTVAVCLDGCSITADDNRQFWSEQMTAPFTWATLFSLGLAEDYAIWASGTPG
jgi:hypothetical protein